MRYLIKFMYDGSNYYGFQRQKDKINVQSELEDALSFIAKEKIEIKGAGRTDRGVHALMQCAHFDLKLKIATKDLKKAIERNCSKNIKILSCDKVKDKFHARFDVKEKIYMYKINIGSETPFLNDYYYQPKEQISIRKLKQVAKLFLGIHDYKNFVSGCHQNTIGEIKKIIIKKKKKEIYLYFVGKSFYRYMVRNIVGAMLDYNKSKVSVVEIKKMLDEPNLKKQLSTAPSQGLYLYKIKY